MSGLLIEAGIVLKTVGIAKRKKMSEDKYIFLTNVRPHYSARRPESDIELEESDEKRRTK